MPIVRDGVLAGFLSSRETAAEIGLERSGGCMRAEGFSRQPIVRMTNVNLEPGDAGQPRRPDRRHRRRPPDRDEPLVVDRQPPAPLPVRGRGRVGDQGGERGRLLRNPSYAGVTPEFWGSCDAVCSPEEWRLISLLDCGKGEPGQVMRVSHGAAPRASATSRWAWREHRRDRRARRPATPAPSAFALVTRERSLMLRFAAGRPTQSTAIDDVTVEIAIPFRGHVGGPRRTRSTTRRSRVRRRARLAAEAAAASGEGRFPGFDPDHDAVAATRSTPRRPSSIRRGGARRSPTPSRWPTSTASRRTDLDGRRAGAGLGDRGRGGGASGAPTPS